MQDNKRQFFRMNVSLPLYVQPLASQNRSAEASHIEPFSKDALFQRCNSQLAELFADKAHLNNGATNLFRGINQRLDFLVWLLDHLIESNDPRQSPDFYQRVDQDRTITLPQGDGQSSVFPLLHALFYRVDELVLNLLDAIEKSADGRVFLFTRPIYAMFSGERYLHNLQTLADKGNWLAQVLQALIFKLNASEQAYAHLKDRFQDLCYPERWPVTAVNLSSGGLSIETEQPYQVDQVVCILLQVDEVIISAQAKVVVVLPISNTATSDCPRCKRVAFEFIEMTADDQARITQFVTAQELASMHAEPK